MRGRWRGNLGHTEGGRGWGKGPSLCPTNVPARAAHCHWDPQGHRPCTPTDTHNMESCTPLDTHNMESCTPLDTHNMEPCTPTDTHNMEPSGGGSGVAPPPPGPPK
uniref:Uncharacterized protein n=1 Tax=Zonotrichia albicollis TaxID=44394 RepID=A0A8D2NLL4_ZONAL